jgi:hypothetical protein
VGLPVAPRVERVRRRAVLRYGCVVVVADTDDLVRVLETSHPLMYYLPRQAFGHHLVPVERASVCEWKGVGPLRRCGRGGCIPITRGRLVVPEARSALPVADQPGGCLQGSARTRRAARSRVVQGSGLGRCVGTELLE